MAAPMIHKTELVEIADLKPHERNYRGHPADQLTHITQSIREHGFYRNVVVANDGTILAGHGVVDAATAEGITTIPVVRLDIGPNDPKALKVLTGDNELTRLAEIDDRLLSELLREIKDTDLDGLLGTGYDEQMLANLVFVTRPASEIGDFNEAAAWVGLPAYEEASTIPKVVVNFDNTEDRDAFLKRLKVKRQRGMGLVISIWWPDRPREDPVSLRFDDR